MEEEHEREMQSVAVYIPRLMAIGCYISAFIAYFKTDGCCYVNIIIKCRCAQQLIYGPQYLH